MVHEDLTGKLANHEDLNTVDYVDVLLFLAIVYSAFLHDAFRNLRIPSPLYYALTLALQCTGRNPSNSSIYIYSATGLNMEVCKTSNGVE